MLPIFNVLWISQIAFSIFLLRQGLWTKRAYQVEIGKKLLELGLLSAIFSALPLFEIDWVRLSAAGWTDNDRLIEGIVTLVPSLNVGVQSGLIIYMVVLVGMIGKSVYRLVTSQKNNEPVLTPLARS